MGVCLLFLSLGVVIIWLRVSHGDQILRKIESASVEFTSLIVGEFERIEYPL